MLTLENCVYENPLYYSCNLSTNLTLSKEKKFKSVQLIKKKNTNSLFWLTNCQMTGNSNPFSSKSKLF